MRAGGGQAKGGQFERDKCRQLSLWITNSKRDDTLWRSSASGATFTTRSKTGREGFESQAGDITSIRKESKWMMDHFGVELKAYKDLKLANVLCGVPSKEGAKDLQGFWFKHVELCKKINKQPILIARQNFKPDLIIGRGSLEVGAGNLLGVHIPMMGATIYRLDQYLESVKYKDWEKAVRSFLSE